MSDEGMRRWQWELLRKNKRPPCLGCWKIESMGVRIGMVILRLEGRGDGGLISSVNMYVRIA